MTYRDEWSEEVRWRDIWRSHMITGTFDGAGTKEGSFKLRGMINKQIEAGNVRQTRERFYQFKNSLVDWQVK